MRVYLASNYHRKAELCGYAFDLEDRGVIVTSTWLRPEELRHGEAEAQAVLAAGGMDAHPDLAQPYAVDDARDLHDADTIIVFTGEPSPRGGKHVEFGMAAAWGKRLVLVGPRENVFHALPEVEQFRSWDDCLAALTVSSASAASQGSDSTEGDGSDGAA